MAGSDPDCPTSPPPLPPPPETPHYTFPPPPYLGVDGVGVDEHTLDVDEVGVVLQCPHVQPRLLAQLPNARPVVMREGAIGQDRVSNLEVWEVWKV